MWQISDRFSVFSSGVLEGFNAGWFYRSCWKYRPCTLMHSWYLHANDCVSRIIAAASATWATSHSWVSYRCLVHRTLHLPPDKEIHRSEIGRTWWPLYWTTHPNQRLGKTLFRYSLTSRAKCAGDPSCWNHNRCLTCSGTFSNISSIISRIKIM